MTLTLFDRIGQEEGIDIFIDNYYRHVFADRLVSFWFENSHMGVRREAMRVALQELLEGRSISSGSLVEQQLDPTLWKRCVMYASRALEQMRLGEPLKEQLLQAFEKLAA